MFSKDSQEVNDLFQEVLINLWKGFSKFEGKSSMKTWIWRVAFNTCISLGRKKKNAFDTVPLNMDIDLFDEKDAENKQIKLLHDRIRLLKPFDRAIVLLWLENMSYEDIGLVVGISTKNVSVRMFRIREELKKMSNVLNSKRNG